MPRVIAALLRHGAYRQPEGVPSAHLPYPLTAEGERQARASAEALISLAQAEKWQVDCTVESSRMLRAWQTAMIVAEVLTRRLATTYRVEEYDALAERGLGALANLTIEQIEEVLRQDPRFAAPPRGWKRDNRFRLPVQGAESLEEAGARAAAHLETRMQSLAHTVRRDTLKVFVGHGGAFRLAAVKLGILDYGQTTGLSMFHCRPIFLEKDAGGRWKHVGGEWKIRGSHERTFD
jgi:2,3-bisphosphoglycerate-dependent phosphoglycerate mutase